MMGGNLVAQWGSWDASRISARERLSPFLFCVGTVNLLTAIVTQIDTLDQRLAGVRSDLARRTLERDLERHNATLLANSSINTGELRIAEILKQLDKQHASPVHVDVADESESVNVPANTSSVDELLKQLDGAR